MDKREKIYVAGHTGMVGSAIVRKLKGEGYNHLCLRTHDEMDLKEINKVEQFFIEERPQYIFMAAAKVGGIKANADSPADFLMENLLIQNNIILMAHKYQVKKVLFLASACIYPKECRQPIAENELLSGSLEPTNEAYAVAKIAGLKACEYYNKQYGDNFITAMPANCYGLNDCFDLENSHVIPAMIRRFHEAKEKGIPHIVFWGTGKPKREFIYVDDLADACIFLMNCYNESQFINIGTEEEVTMEELAGIIAELVGYTGKIVFDDTKADGMLRRKLDNTRAVNLGWKPMTALKEGLKQVYEEFLRTSKTSVSSSNEF